MARRRRYFALLFRENKSGKHTLDEYYRLAGDLSAWSQNARGSSFAKSFLLWLADDPAIDVDFSYDPYIDREFWMVDGGIWDDLMREAELDLPPNEVVELAWHLWDQYLEALVVSPKSWWLDSIHNYMQTGTWK